eukprot:2310325-Prymnesium_polylepis.1
MLPAVVGISTHSSSATSGAGCADSEALLALYASRSSRASSVSWNSCGRSAMHGPLARARRRGRTGCGPAPAGPVSLAALSRR